MADSNKSNFCPKAACSVSEMATLCGLSRARFYDLIRSEVMPPPCFDVRTRRPLYPMELQQLCITIRQTNLALDGCYVVFNNRRTRTSEITSKPANKLNSFPIETSIEGTKEITEALRDLGFNEPESEIEKLVQVCYPDGLRGAPLETALKTVLREIRRLHAA